MHQINATVIGEAGVSTSSKAAGKNCRSTRQRGGWRTAGAGVTPCELGASDACEIGSLLDSSLLLPTKPPAFTHRTVVRINSSKPSATEIAAAGDRNAFTNEAMPDGLSTSRASCAARFCKCTADHNSLSADHRSNGRSKPDASLIASAPSNAITAEAVTRKKVLIVFENKPLTVRPRCYIPEFPKAWRRARSRCGGPDVCPARRSFRPQ